MAKPGSWDSTSPELSTDPRARQCACGRLLYPGELCCSTPTPAELDYRERSRVLYNAGLSEPNPELRDALLVQSERVAMRALTLELARKQAVLKAVGIPLTA